MGYKKPTNVTRKELINFPLPHHGGKYKTVSHKFVIEQVQDKLKSSNLEITNQIYKANKNGSVAQAQLHIRPLLNDIIDDDLGMMFAWVNSYDKSVRFSCGIGAYVTVCSNGMIGGELGYSRKHIGTADYDIIKQINRQIDKAAETYKSLIADKKQFLSTYISLKEQSSLLGRLFVEEELLDPGQLSIVKNEIKKPTYNYNCDADTVWSFYNHVTHAMKKTHPKKWMSDQKKFHDFMTMTFVSNSASSMQDTCGNLIEDDLEDEVYDAIIDTL